METGQRIRLVREAFHLTQSQLLMAINEAHPGFNMAQNTLSQIENGKIKAELSLLNKISSLEINAQRANKAFLFEGRGAPLANTEEVDAGETGEGVVVLDKIEYGKLLGKMEYAIELNQAFMSRIEAVLKHTESSLGRLKEHSRDGPQLASSKR